MEGLGQVSCYDNKEIYANGEMELSKLYYI